MNKYNLGQPGSKLPRFLFTGWYISSLTLFPPKVNRATVLCRRYCRHGKGSLQIKHLGYIPVDVLYPDLKHIFTSFFPVTKNFWCTGCDSEEKVLPWGHTGTIPTCFSTVNWNRLQNVESIFTWWKLKAEDFIVFIWLWIFKLTGIQLELTVFWEDYFRNNFSKGHSGREDILNGEF